MQAMGEVGAAGATRAIQGKSQYSSYTIGLHNTVSFTIHTTYIYKHVKNTDNTYANITLDMLQKMTAGATEESSKFWIIPWTEGWKHGRMEGWWRR